MPKVEFHSGQVSKADYSQIIEDLAHFDPHDKRIVITELSKGVWVPKVEEKSWFSALIDPIWKPVTKRADVVAKTTLEFLQNNEDKFTEKSEEGVLHLFQAHIWKENDLRTLASIEATITQDKKIQAAQREIVATVERAKEEANNIKEDAQVVMGKAKKEAAKTVAEAVDDVQRLQGKVAEELKKAKEEGEAIIAKAVVSAEEEGERVLSDLDRKKVKKTGEIKELEKDIKTLQCELQKFQDTIIICRDKDVGTHTHLFSEIPFFQAFIRQKELGKRIPPTPSQKDDFPNAQHVITLVDYSAETVELYLSILLKGLPNEIPDEQIDPLLRLADYFQDPATQNSLLEQFTKKYEDRIFSPQKILKFLQSPSSLKVSYSIQLIAQDPHRILKEIGNSLTPELFGRLLQEESIVCLNEQFLFQEINNHKPPNTSSVNFWGTTLEDGTRLIDWLRYEHINEEHVQHFIKEGLIDPNHKTNRPARTTGISVIQTGPFTNIYIEFSPEEIYKDRKDPSSYRSTPFWFDKTLRSMRIHKWNEKQFAIGMAPAVSLEKYNLGCHFIEPKELRQIKAEKGILGGLYNFASLPKVNGKIVWKMTLEELKG